MAERRMFAKSIIGSARFLRMPSTARLLYYDLGMAADDDGVVEAFAVMRTIGATEDDLRVLETKNFINVLNDDLVSYIVDWKKNNLIKSDRYRPGIYHELLVQLGNGTQMEPNRNQNGTQMEPQVRLGKDNTPYIPQKGEASEAFIRFWEKYPKKKGKQAAKKAFAKLCPDETLLGAMLCALEKQRLCTEWQREGGRFIPLPASWINGRRWEDEQEETEGRWERLV